MFEEDLRKLKHMGSTSVIFTGDIGFDKYMEGRWADPALLSDELMQYLHSADHLVVNVEGAMAGGVESGSNQAGSMQSNVSVTAGTTGGQQGDFVHGGVSAPAGATGGQEVTGVATSEKTGGQQITGAISSAAAALKHTMDPGATQFLDRIGADIWNLVNNHIMDAGPQGLADTLAHAKLHEAKTIGVGMNLYDAMKPVIIPEAGGIGMFGVGYQRACRKADTDTPGCFSWSDMENIRKVISEIKKTCRWCIVVSHGGEEFTSLPNRYTRDRYLEYLEMGADIVVAHHPHVPMNYETFPGKAIFYSLGNFVFDTDYQRSQYHTDEGILVKLSFTEDEFSWDAKGLRIVRGPETIEAAPLPDIFTDVQQEEYELLEPLAAKMFIAATKRQLRYMKPDVYENATEEMWMENFYQPLRSGRVPGEVLDMQIVVPIAAKADEEAWKQSKLLKVVRYIQEQM